jgi:hypothetical protein
MTRDDILKMAREAGIDAWWDSGNEHREVLQEHLERLVRLAYEAGADAEREACVRVLEDYERFGDTRDCAAAIRARGEK